MCVDRETGLSLQATAYDRHGKPHYCGTYLAFDTNPDLTGIEFPPAVASRRGAEHRPDAR